MRFIVFGPYDVPTKIGKAGRRVINFELASNVFSTADADSQRRYGFNVSDAIGCYVFALSPSGAPTMWPYYVGRTSRQSLRKRVFQKQDKEPKYNDILKCSGYEKASPRVFFLPLITESERLARVGSNASIVDRAEYLLIGLANTVNPDLWNIQHKALLDGFVIDGVHNHRTRGVRTKPVRELRNLMGLSLRN